MGYLTAIEELNRILQVFTLNDEAYFRQFISEVAKRLGQGHKLLVFGNGGSASQAQHLAAELVNRFFHDRPPIKAIALTTDTSILTSVANDSDFRLVFARQIEALGEEGDVALGLTTSGRSPNVIEAFSIARQKKMLTACLTGEKGRSLQGQVDYLFALPSASTPRLQEAHLFLLHQLAQEVEEKVFSNL